MAFYPPNPGRGPFPPRYRQNFGLPASPPSLGRQAGPMPGPSFRRQASFYQQQSLYNQNQMGMQGLTAYNPNQQVGTRGLSGNLSTLMGHVDTVTNGVNMLRQLGSLMSLFR